MYVGRGATGLLTSLNIPLSKLYILGNIFFWFVLFIIKDKNFNPE